MEKKRSIGNLYGIFNFLKKDECVKSTKKIDLSDLYNNPDPSISFFNEYMSRIALAKETRQEIDDLKTFLSNLEYITYLDVKHFLMLMENKPEPDPEDGIIIQLMIEKFLKSPKGYEKLLHPKTDVILSTLGLDNIIAIFDEQYGYDPYTALSEMLKEAKYNDDGVIQGLILFFANQKRKKYWDIASQKDGVFNFTVKKYSHMSNIYYVDMIHLLEKILADEVALEHLQRQEGEDFCPQELLDFLKKEFEIEWEFDQGEDNFFDKLPHISSEKLDIFFQRNSMKRLNLMDLQGHLANEHSPNSIVAYYRLEKMFVICPRALAIYMKYHQVDNPGIERMMLINDMLPKEQIVQFGVSLENIDYFMEKFGSADLMEFLLKPTNPKRLSFQKALEFIENFGKEYTVEEVEEMRRISLDESYDDDENDDFIEIDFWKVFLSSRKYVSDFIKKGGNLQHEDLLFLYDRNMTDLVFEYHKVNKTL